MQIKIHCREANYFTSITPNGLYITKYLLPCVIRFRTEEGGLNAIFLLYFVPVRVTIISFRENTVNFPRNFTQIGGI